MAKEKRKNFTFFLVYCDVTEMPEMDHWSAGQSELSTACQHPLIVYSATHSVNNPGLLPAPGLLNRLIRRSLRSSEVYPTRSTELCDLELGLTESNEARSKRDD
jgi:hypothetical protein